MREAHRRVGIVRAVEPGFDSAGQGALGETLEARKATFAKAQQRIYDQVMMVKFGEDGVKTIEDFAGYSADDLVGWKERKDGETKREPGFLDGFELSRQVSHQLGRRERRRGPRGREGGRARGRARS